MYARACARTRTESLLYSHSCGVHDVRSFVPRHEARVSISLQIPFNTIKRQLYGKNMSFCEFSFSRELARPHRLPQFDRRNVSDLLSIPFFCAKLLNRQMTCLSMTWAGNCINDQRKMSKLNDARGPIAHHKVRKAQQRYENLINYIMRTMNGIVSVSGRSQFNSRLLNAPLFSPGAR